jgi:hypothetical protein
MIARPTPKRNHYSIYVFLFFLGTFASTAGCESYTSVDDKGRVVVHHIGYVKLVKPPVYPNDKEINVTGASLIGFSVGNGFTVGYKRNEFIQVPMDCRVLVIVENSEQFSHLLNEFSALKGGDICATVSPN